MAKVVIFGVGQVAETVYDYISTDSEHEIVGFTIDQDWLKVDTFKGLPVVPFEKITSHFPPADFKLFTALSFKNVNQIRREKYLAAKKLGYSFITYQSLKSHIWPSATVGENSFLMEANVIQPYASIGNNVIMWSGNHIGHHTTIEDHCFIASHAVISGSVRIGEGTFVGVNATMRDNISIGKRCVIGAGALVLHDVPDDSVLAAQETKISSRSSAQLKSI